MLLAIIMPIPQSNSISQSSGFVICSPFILPLKAVLLVESYPVLLTMVSCLSVAVTETIKTSSAASPMELMLY